MDIAATFSSLFPKSLPMTFMWPHLLWLLMALPLLVVLYAWLLGRKKNLALRFASLSIVREAMGTGPSVRRHIPPLLFLLAIAARRVSSFAQAARRTAPPARGAPAAATADAAT